MARSATKTAQSKQKEENDKLINQQKLMDQMQQIQSLSQDVIKKKLNEQRFSFEYLGISNISRGQIVSIFNEIRCIIVMGPESRSKKIAQQCVDKLNISKQYQKIGNSEFFSIYKIGTILTCSHGMGLSSVCLFLNELLRIMNISKNNNFELIRIGSSGGIGVEGGTIIISTDALNCITMKPEWTYFSCGHLIKQECIFNQQIYKRLYAISKAKKYNVKYGKTVSCETYYEGQARLDGALCKYSNNDKNKYLEKLYKNGVRNFEMEGTVVSGICTRNNIKCGMICVAYLNRLKEDTVSKNFTQKEISSWMDKAIDVLIQYIYQFVLKK